MTDFGWEKLQERIAEFRESYQRLFPEPNYRDITREVQESPVILGDIISGKKPIRKGNTMPAKITVSSFNSLAGKRGRKASADYSDWEMGVGDTLDIGDDFAEFFANSYGEGMDFLAVFSEEKDGEIIAAKKSAIAAVKYRAAKGNDGAKQGDFEIGIAADDSGNEILALVRNK